MELLFNGFIGLVLLMFFIASTKIEEITISTDRIGAKGFPQMVIGISLILLIYITYDYIKNRDKTAAKEKPNLADKGYRIMLISIALLATYIFTMNIVGFIIGTFVFSMVAAKVMGYNENLKTFIFSSVLTVSITLIFGKLFFVSLPRGIGILREMSYLIY